MRTVAIALGTLIGIYSEQCGRDNHPEARGTGPVFSQIVTVNHQENWDAQGLEFFEIRNTQGAALVTVSGGLELARVLRSVDGQKVRLVIETPELERIER